MTSTASSPLNILIACGGTGGHLFPGIAVAQKLKELGHKPTLLISQKKVDSQASSPYADLDFRTVDAIAMPKVPSIGLMKFFWKFLSTYLKSRQIIKCIKADAIIGMGGFTSLPPIMAGKHLGKTTYVHDSNALPGKANRMAARWCDHILIGMEEAQRYFKGRSCLVTGTPLRTEFLHLPTVEEARSRFGIPQDGKKVVLAMGGSQGAQKLNTIMTETAQTCADLCHFIILTGKTDYERVRGLTQHMPHVHVVEFCGDMPSAYAASDMVIARAGASSITELAATQTPSFLVPYPYAADNHQFFNAKAYAANGASRFYEEKDLQAEILVNFLREVLPNDEKLSAMREAARATSIIDAADRINRIIEQQTPSH